MSDMIIFKKFLQADTPITFIQSVVKLQSQTSCGDRRDRTKVYCQRTVCRRCVLPALGTVILGLAKFGNQANPLKYSEKKMYFVTN